MNIQDEQLTIQQVAAATDMSVHTLRYYERIGLIHSIRRAENTHRRYTPADIGWINFLNKLRAIGMSIQEMQVYTALQREGDHTLLKRVEILKTLQYNLVACIAEMNQHLKLIDFKIETYEQMISDQVTEPT